uniref:Uncharacterized protein n=1 Tax=Rhizophora mucronata TaxID=61149 RepID=A0A2P2N305_RHIMU
MFPAYSYHTNKLCMQSKCQTLPNPVLTKGTENNQSRFKQ